MSGIGVYDATTKKYVDKLDESEIKNLAATIEKYACSGGPTLAEVVNAATIDDLMIRGNSGLAAVWERLLNDPTRSRVLNVTGRHATMTDNAYDPDLKKTVPISPTSWDKFRAAIDNLGYPNQKRVQVLGELAALIASHSG